jgi:hypothetical protein
VGKNGVMKKKVDIMNGNDADLLGYFQQVCMSSQLPHVRRLYASFLLEEVKRLRLNPENQHLNGSLKKHLSKK